MASVNIKEDDIYLTSKNINPEKAHGWNNISIRTIQLCKKVTVEPLRNFFSFLEEGTYPDNCKKSNVTTIHKKEKKLLLQIINRLASFLSSEMCFKESLLPFYLITSLEISYLLNVNQFSYQLIFASYNSFPLHTKYINGLIATLQST